MAAILNLKNGHHNTGGIKTLFQKIITNQTVAKKVLKVHY